VGCLDRYRYSDFNQPEKDHENVRLFGKGGGRFYGKVADGQEKERERAQRWKKVEREKERKGFRHKNPFSNPDHTPKIPALLDINSNLVFQFSL